MKKALLDVVFASEKRKRVILLLRDGAKGMEFLMDSLDTKRTVLNPQMKILEEHYLVAHDKDAYKLTAIGKLVADEMFSLLSTINTFDSDIDYWGTHEFDFIPPALLKRIDELEGCKVKKPSFTEMQYLNEDLHSNTLRSRSLYGIVRLFSGDYKEILSQLLENNISLYVILSKDLYQKLLADDYTVFSSLVEEELFHFFVYPEEIRFAELIYNDHCVFMRLLRNDGSFDPKYMLASSPSSVKWAQDVFKYCLKDSTAVNKV